MPRLRQGHIAFLVVIKRYIRQLMPKPLQILVAVGICHCEKGIEVISVVADTLLDEGTITIQQPGLGIFQEMLLRSGVVTVHIAP